MGPDSGQCPEEESTETGERQEDETSRHFEHSFDVAIRSKGERPGPLPRARKGG
jgi:hypothetical protein